jgi:methionine sulfoxide reductase heme-binding subunit
MKKVLLKLQQILVRNKALIINCFFAFELTIVGVVAVGAYFYWNQPEMWVIWYNLGLNFGQLALISYLITLIPGILTRLKIQPLIGVLITPFRRHFGITMFLSAWAHLSLTTTFPLLSQGLPLVLMLPQIVGLIGWWLLFPLWLTSNDWSQKKLGPKWKMLHKLTYIALFFIFFHVALMIKTRWAILAGIVLVAEVLSWLVVWQRGSQKVASSSTAPTNPSPPVPPASGTPPPQSPA